MRPTEPPSHKCVWVPIRLPFPPRDTWQKSLIAPSGLRHNTSEKPVRDRYLFRKRFEFRLHPRVESSRQLLRYNLLDITPGYLKEIVCNAGHFLPSAPRQTYRRLRTHVANQLHTRTT